MAAFAALVVSVVLTGIMRELAPALGLIDVPNERSSHRAPTPRGGGVSIVVAATAALVVLAFLGALRIELFFALTGGGVAVAAVGLLDDRRRLPAGARLAVHVVAALCALILLGGLPPLRIAQQVIAFGWFGYVLGTLGIVWVVNLFNFMDGIDGLAASEAVFVACAGALLAILTRISTDVAAAGFAVAAACCGFSCWNWPPAKIFMGDVGSLSLGGTLGTIAVIIKQEILLFFVGGVFVVEALSVILQVGSFKLRGKRIFRMAPIHHHFELLGWSESKVIVRFWIAALVFALFALTTLKLR